MASVSCNELSVNPGSPYYYTESWKHCGVEDFVTWLLTEGRGNLDIYTVTDAEQYRYEYDFYGYLTDVHKVTLPYLWDITLRLNHMYRPDEFGKGVIAVAIIKSSFTDGMMQKILAYRGQ